MSTILIKLCEIKVLFDLIVGTAFLALQVDQQSSLNMLMVKWSSKEIEKLKQKKKRVTFD